MNTKSYYWIDFNSVSISVDYRVFNRVVNCCDDNKISYNVNNEIIFKDNEEGKVVRTSLIIEECWATLLVTKLAED